MTHAAGWCGKGVPRWSAGREAAMRELTDVDWWLIEAVARHGAGAVMAFAVAAGCCIVLGGAVMGHLLDRRRK